MEQINEFKYRLFFEKYSNPESDEKVIASRKKSLIETIFGTNSRTEYKVRNANAYELEE